jgi:hypothetical protein
VPFDHLKPVEKFTDRSIAVNRIWQAIQKLAVAREAATVAPQGSDSAPSANVSTNFTTSQLRRPKGARRAKASAAAQPKRTKVRNKHAREGSRKAEIVALIERPQGATLAEIRKATGCQAHSVCGFISGTVGKKMGLAVGSVRREDGQRVYRLAGVRRKA